LILSFSFVSGSENKGIPSCYFLTIHHDLIPKSRDRLDIMLNQIQMWCAPFLPRQKMLIIFFFFLIPNLFFFFWVLLHGENLSYEQKFGKAQLNFFFQLLGFNN